MSLLTTPPPPTLPDAHSPSLHLAHPTPDELLRIWTLTSDSWKGALSLSQYLSEAVDLLTAPLNVNGGLTHWVLVDSALPPDQRPILSSCETIRKRSLLSCPQGKITETITHGVASVYSDPKFRGRGYASRMLKDLAILLRTWQSEIEKPIASILFSDIGKKFYANLGWIPFPSNHLEFDALSAQKRLQTTPLLAENLAELCKLDEVLINQELLAKRDGKTRIMLVPDENSMLWFHRKEEFLAQHVYKRPVPVKGAVIGEIGSRVWAIWSRFCQSPLEDGSGNSLLILRLVIENQAEGQLDLQATRLRCVLQAAQEEADAWHLPMVEMWNPSPLIETLVERTGIAFLKVKREEEHICSLLWYGEGPGTQEDVEWYGNEKFGWC
jgi:GNAT superfamily N-acetyltransferase